MGLLSVITTHSTVVAHFICYKSIISTANRLISFCLILPCLFCSTLLSVAVCDQLADFKLCSLALSSYYTGLLTTVFVVHMLELVSPHQNSCCLQLFCLLRLRLSHVCWDSSDVFFSSISTLWPFNRDSIAHARPANPHPTTITLMSDGELDALTLTGTTIWTRL